MIRVQKQMGKIPIMVKVGPIKSRNVMNTFNPLIPLPFVYIQSKRCNLYGMTPAQLVRHEEEPGEVGGYFICNGIEKVMRLLIVPRANMVMSNTNMQSLY